MEQDQNGEVTEQKSLYPHNALRQLKSLRRLGVQEIAQMAGVSIGTVNEALKGSTKVGVEKFADVADALGADLEIRLNLRDPELMNDLLPASGSQATAQAAPAQ